MSVDIKNLEEALLKNKPNLTANSIKTYLSVFRTVAKKIGEDLTEPNDFVKHREKIMKYMNELSASMRKSRIAAILSLLGKYQKGDGEKEEAVKMYTEKMNNALEEYAETANDQELNERQKQNFVSWNEIGILWKKMEKLTRPLWNLDVTFGNDVFDIIMHFVVLSLYYLTPPRRSADYIYMKIRNYNEGSESKDNYIEKLNKKYYFVFNNYKNSTRLGKQVLEVPTELKKILQKWIAINKTDWLIPNRNNKVSQTNKLNMMFKQIFNKDIGPSLLRHAYVTHHFGNVDLEKLEDATQKMGSSNIKTVLQYSSKEHSEKTKL